MVKDILLVMIGSGVGGGLRYAISLATRALLPLPYLFLSTIVINILGSFVVGMIFAVLIDEAHNHWFRLLVAVGFCGGFTTFSAFAFEASELTRQGNFLLSLIYIWSSVGISLLSVWAGYALVK